MSKPLEPIAHCEVRCDSQVMFELQNLKSELARFGGQLREEKHSDWWRLNDLLDDVVGLERYLQQRLANDPV